MIHTFQIDDSTPNAKAFLAFIKSLEFVREADNVLSENQLTELNKRRQNRVNENSKSYSWSEVKEFAIKSQSKK